MESDCNTGQRESQMKNLPKIVLAALVLGLVVQSGQFASRWTARESFAPPSSGWIVGDTLTELVGVDQNGRATVVDIRTGTQAATIVYAFHSECVHCHDVAPAWSSHFAAADTESVRRVALTRDPPEQAAAYAERFQWDVTIVSISQPSQSDGVLPLVSRTPWLFVFDGSGALRLEAHGSELDRVEGFVASLVAEPSAQPLAEG